MYDYYYILILRLQPITNLHKTLVPSTRQSRHIIASNVGNAVFVVESNAGHRGATQTALRRLRTGHAHILGAVLNKFDPKKSASTDNYYGYDYYQYGAD